MEVRVSLEIEHTALSELMKILDKEDVKLAAKTRQRKKEDPKDVPEEPVKPEPIQLEVKEEPVKPEPIQLEVKEEPAKTEVEITDSAIKSEAAKLIRANRQAELKSLLDKYGAVRVSSIQQDKRRDFLNDLEAMLK